MNLLTKSPPEAVMEMVTLHMACGKSRSICVVVIIEEAGGVEGVCIAVAVFLSIQSHEVGHDDGAFGNELAVIENVFCDARWYVCGLEL